MKNPLYICYDPKQKKYLNDHNERYHVCGLNPNNHRTFWVFMRTENLDNLLKKWGK